MNVTAYHITDDSPYKTHENMTDIKKRTGIWLDYREAFVIPLFDEKEAKPIVAHIKSEIDTGVAKGGSRSKTPYGPQGGVSESEIQERRFHQEKSYFESILNALSPETDELFIFGPAGAKVGLKKAIDQIKKFGPQVVAVQSADKMTQNQMVAAVRQFFIEQEV